MTDSPVLTSPCRIGVVSLDAAGDPSGAVALRTLELLLLRRLPSANLQLLATSSPAGPPWQAARSVQSMDAAVEGRWAVLGAQCDLLFVWVAPDVGGVPGVASAARAQGAEVVVCTAPALTVCELADEAQGPWFAASRRALLRALAWLPSDPATPYAVVDAPAAETAEQEAQRVEAPGERAVVVLPMRAEFDPPSVTSAGPRRPSGLVWLGQPSGIDELVSAVTGAQSHLGDDPLPRAILRGRAPRSAAAKEVLALVDGAARSAAAVWQRRQGRGGVVDQAAERARGTERAVLQCDIHLARRAADEASMELAALVRSRSWRLTAPLRAGRRSLGR